MDGSNSRGIIAQLIIIGAVCVGGWSMFVEPRASALSEIEAQIAESRSGNLPLDEQLKEAGSRLKSVRAQLQPIERANAMGGDSSRLYGRVMSLAQQCGVRLERLQPSLEARMAADGAASSTSVDMTVNGTFADVLEFVGRVQNLPGYISPQTLSIGPSGTMQNPKITARFACDVLRFEVPDVLISMGGEDDAE